MSIHQKSPRRAETPPGPPIFGHLDDPTKLRRRKIFLALYILVTSLLVWPIFPAFSGIRPLILGLPLSLAWVVLALAVMFAALIWLYRTEDHEPPRT